MSIYDEILHDIEMLYEKTSKKEQHRIDNFKKRHKYDEESGTIETDIVDKKTGKKQRINFEITNGPPDSDEVETHRNSNDDMTHTIRMPRTTLKQKPQISTSALKHEEGHIDQLENPEKYSKLYKQITDILSKYNDELTDHGKVVDEYIADIYAANHSAYGIHGFKKMCNNLRENISTLKRVNNQIYANTLAAARRNPKEFNLKPAMVEEINRMDIISKIDDDIIELYEKIIDIKKHESSDTNRSMKIGAIQRMIQILKTERNSNVKVLREIKQILSKEKKQFKHDMLKMAAEDFDYDEHKKQQQREMDLRRDIASKFSGNKAGELK